MFLEKVTLRPRGLASSAGGGGVLFCRGGLLFVVVDENVFHGKLGRMPLEAIGEVGMGIDEDVELLAEDVRKAVQQGHTVSAIKEALEKAGIQAPLSRLKALLGEKEAGSPQD